MSKRWIGRISLNIEASSSLLLVVGADVSRYLVGSKPVFLTVLPPNGRRSKLMITRFLGFMEHNAQMNKSSLQRPNESWNSRQRTETGDLPESYKTFKEYKCL